MPLRDPILDLVADRGLTRLKLRSVELENFRSVKTADIDLKPFSLVVGANSAGKSSLLSLLRLLAQAQQQDENAMAVSLNGKDLSLGTFRALLHRSKSGVPGQEIIIGLTFDGDVSRRISTDSRQYHPFRSQIRGIAVPTDRQFSVRIELTLKESEVLGDGVGEVVRFIGTTYMDGRPIEVLNLQKPVDSIEGRSPDALDTVTQVIRDMGLEGTDIAKNLVSTSLGILARSAKDESFDVMLSRWMFQTGDSPDDDHSDDAPLLTGTLALISELGNPFAVRTIGAWTSLGGLPVNFGTAETPIARLKSLIDRIEQRIELIGEAALSRRGRLRDADKTSGDGPIRVEDFVGSFMNLVGEPDDVASHERFVDQMTQRLLAMARNWSAPDEWNIEAARWFFEELRSRWDEIESSFSDANQLWSQPRVYPVDTSVLGSTLGAIARFFGTSIDYLGPLRQGPKPLYSYGERGTSTELGQGGEYFAYYLSRYRDMTIQPELSGLNQPGPTTLVDAMSNWARKLGVAQKVEVKEVPGTGRRVEVLMPGVPEAMTWDKVGIGVSQVLPVLLKVLSSSPQSVVLLEQPELHLHPDSQAELAQFLFQASQTGRQIIVETHSDTFLTRLRRLVVDGTLRHEDTARTSISFVFAHRDPDTGVTKFENVFVDQTGTFPYWPEGFADRATEEAKKLLEARIQVLDFETEANA